MLIRCVPCEPSDPDRGLVGKRDVQAGGEDQIVVLGASGRIRDVDVSELILPSEPLVELRDRANSEREAVLARLLQVREKTRFGDFGAFPKLST